MGAPQRRFSSSGSQASRGIFRQRIEQNGLFGQSCLELPIQFAAPFGVTHQQPVRGPITRSRVSESRCQAGDFIIVRSQQGLKLAVQDSVELDFNTEKIGLTVW